MGVLMVHDTKDDGMVGMAEAKIAGQHTPARQYVHEGHFLHVDGPAHAHTHDVEQLQQLGYRLATAQEQEQHAKAKRGETSIREDTTQANTQANDTQGSDPQEVDTKQKRGATREGKK